MGDIKNYITRQGLDLMREELGDLVEQRPALMDFVKNSREIGGDDNTDLTSALKEVDTLDEKIASIRCSLLNADVQRSIEPNVVGFGDVVTIENEEDESSTYKIVGTNEINYWDGAVSACSPIGQAIIGSVVGDEIDVVLPATTVSYTIVDINQDMYTAD